MSAKAFANVVRSFASEAENVFRFLVEEFNMAGPRREDDILPSVCYSGSKFGYDVILDTQDVTVRTSVWANRNDSRVRVDLEKLLKLTQPIGGGRIYTSAQTVAALKKSLANQAEWVRVIHAQISSSLGPEIIHKARV
jgi:hypothetical protein